MQREQTPAERVAVSVVLVAITVAAVVLLAAFVVAAVRVIL